MLVVATYILIFLLLYLSYQHLHIHFGLQSTQAHLEIKQFICCSCEAVNLSLVASLDLCVKLCVSFCSQVAHPPGYPLFTLLARLAMCLLPSLSPAHSVNLMCSLLGAAACGALCISVCW